MLGLIAATLLVIVMPHGQEEGLAPYIERWPDGSVKIEVERSRSEDGEERWHGSYEEFAEDGTKIARGKYQEGKRAGTWTFFHPEGKRRETGRYKAGSRTGKWKGFLPDGTADPELTGRYGARATFEHILGTGNGSVLNGRPQLVEAKGHAKGAVSPRVDPFGYRSGLIVTTAQCMLALEAPLWAEDRKRD